MAAKNLKRNSKFNQKREVSVGVFELGYADITGDGSVVATFAANSVITKVVVIETAEVKILVEYIEYTQTNGEYTQS